MSVLANSNTAVANNAIVLGPYDTDNSNSYGISSNQLTLQIDNLGGGLIAEQSNDKVTWYTLQTLSTTGVVTVSLGTRFVRVRATGAGTPVVALRLSSSFIPAPSAGGGGAATIADGADVTQGAKADAVATDDTSWSIVSILKSVAKSLRSVLSVGGNVASAVADSGNPVKVGGQVAATLLAANLTTGTRSEVLLNNRGATMVAPSAPYTPADALSNTALNGFVGTSGGAQAGVPIVSGGLVFNGTTWDRRRGNTDGAYTLVGASADTNVAITPVVTTVAAALLVAKASAGNVYSVSCTTGATAGYLMLFDATTAPADGTVTPKETIPVAANTAIKLDYFVPSRMATGITLVFSSTGPFTKTASATAFLKAMVK